ncbi:MAG: aspartate--tRNA ligase [bacterium]|nr:aspartate--tRNA ligase [bacterium]
MERTLTFETLQKIGQEATLCGWVHVRRDHGKIVFIDLRDRWGLMQVVFTPGHKEVYALAQTLRPEWVVKVSGMVKERPEKLANPKLPTGKIELEATALEVLNSAQTPPFALDTDGYEIGEEHRMKYRYLDLRRDRMKKNLMMRSGIIQMMRRFLGRNNFIEIETPILTRSTPEGARDYVVPSRLHAGKFYALPQSPQQYKQLLMVAGIDRYFQIARCFRDEDTRGDRQPEFTQLDIEMSFADQNQILQLVEDLYIDIVRHVDRDKKKIHQVPFPRITYKEAEEKWKSDKPDLRENTKDPNELAFAYIVDFPLFEWKESEKRWDATHHPFTAPQFLKGETTEAFIRRMKEDPGSVLAQQYDLVCNGYELGGGSIRIHDAKLLSAIFEFMGHSASAVREKFGHMLDAFTYGVPPHGGMAPGIDRLVMLLMNEPNIREVIAFPKTGDGRDLMMDGPSGLEERQLKELHIKIQK